jgi:hypothetical protein
MFPTGTQSVTYGGDTFLKDHLESHSTLLFEQPLRLVKIYVMPREKGLSVEDFVKRNSEQIGKDGMKLLPRNERLELPAYRFEHYEYEEKIEGKTLSSFVYVGPYGNHVVVLKFTCEREQHEACRPYVEKIMRSFKPGWKSKKAMVLEDPAYGEFAGKGLEELEL